LNRHATIDGDATADENTTADACTCLSISGVSSIRTDEGLAHGDVIGPWLVSGAVRRHVGLALDSHDRNARGAPIVFATLPGERHELGLLMCAMLCASRGYKVHYLGPDVPVEDIARYAGEVSAGVVALSVILLDTLASAPEQLHDLAQRVKPGTSIWLGGSATSHLPRKALPRACVVIPDQRDLERRLDLLQVA
jgi:methylmalonyl-CoA mutase cobalamin-binding subunit